MDLSPSSPELYTPAASEGPALEPAAPPAPISSNLGTLPEALLAARQSGVALARPDHPDQALSWDALMETVQRAQEQVCPGDPPRAYALRRDGAVVNTALDRVEYVPVLATPTAPVSLRSHAPAPGAPSPGPSGVPLDRADVPAWKTATASVLASTAGYLMSTAASLERTLIDPEVMVADLVDTNRDMVHGARVMIDSTRPGKERIEGLGQVLTSAVADLVAAPLVTLARGMPPPPATDLVPAPPSPRSPGTGG